MNKRIVCVLSLFLTVALLFPGYVFASSPINDGNDLPVWSSVSAQSFCLLDADTGDVLIASRENERLPMASTTKIMTCLVALEEGDIHSKVIIPSEAVGIEGSSIYLSKGETLTLLELLYGLMLESANDAAVAIALHVSGSVEAFAEKMNEKASALGLSNTHFANPNGLQDELHYSSALDLSRLMSEAMKNDVFAEISSTKTKSISAPDGKTRFLSNHNRLLRDYEDCVAGKTGYTKTAGRCLVTAAERNGKTLICTTLGAPDDWQDHKSLYRDGFSQYESRCILETGGFSEKVNVVGGRKSKVLIINRDSFYCMLRADEKVETVIELPNFMYAPVSEGEQVGSLAFIKNGKELGRVPLFVVEGCEAKEVKLGFWQRIWNRICEWFE